MSSNRFETFDVAELQMLGLGLEYVREHTESWRGHEKFAALRDEAQAALSAAVEQEVSDGT